MFLALPPSQFHFPYIFTPACWDHVPSKLPVLTFLTQALLLEEPILKKVYLKYFILSKKTETQSKVTQPVNDGAIMANLVLCFDASVVQMISVIFFSVLIISESIHIHVHIFSPLHYVRNIIHEWLVPDRYQW